MNSRTTFAAVLAAFSVLVPVLPAAHAAPLLSVEATFVGNDPSVECKASRCTYTHSSDVCYAAGVNSSGFPYSGLCSASLTYSIRTTRVRAAYVCAGLADDATFTFALDTGQRFTRPATVVVKHGAATWTSEPIVNAGGYAALGAGAGTVKPACVGREGVPAAFQGRFSYVTAG